MSQLQPYHPMLWLRAPTYASSLPLAVRDRGHRTGTWSSGPTADQRGVQVTSQANTGSGKTRGMVSRTHKLVQAINPSELAQRMRDRRAARGLTIQQATEEAGVSAATFSRVPVVIHYPTSGTFASACPVGWSCQRSAAGDKCSRFTETATKRRSYTVRAKPR